MSQPDVKKQYRIVALIVAVLVVINIAGFLFFWRPHVPPNTFGGKVSALSDHMITLVDARGGVGVFTITSSTKIFTGKNVAPETEVTVGMFVMLSVEAPGPAATATKIRILSTDPFMRQPKSVAP